MYKYDKKNLMEIPESYQKSDFEGHKFLSFYIKSRNEIISITSSEKNINQFSELQQIFETKFLIKNKNEIIEKNVVTKELFIFLLNSVIKSNPVNEIKEIIDLFLKKFEISKKIFTTYDIGKKKTSEIHDELDNYILFSLICLKIYEYTKNLKYLNTSLKLNDIISSNIRIVKKHNLSQIINFIIKNEIKMIKKLSKENDVVV
tara:strand:+ start:255 stop:863 length:609 start_codon:yes stop_codon:yes gene_type:complete